MQEGSYRILVVASQVGEGSGGVVGGGGSSTVKEIRIDVAASQLEMVRACLDPCHGCSAREALAHALVVSAEPYDGSPLGWMVGRCLGRSMHRH